VAKGRKIEDESDARRCLAAAKASGGAQREWAHQHGVDARSLHMWRVILARRGSVPTRSRRRSTRTEKAAKGLVELVPTSYASSATCRTTGTPARYMLDVDGARLEFGDDFSAATLLRVLEALRSC